VLLLDGENTGDATASLRDARSLTISDDEFKAFIDRHAGQPCLVPEDNKAMRDTYLNLDEEMRYNIHLPSVPSFLNFSRFLNCQNGGKVPGRSILKVGVRAALQDAGFDASGFHERGGVYDWTAPRYSPSEKELEW
jgi:radical S-adenosyl methionine domain-containing protein 2